MVACQALARICDSEDYQTDTVCMYVCMYVVSLSLGDADGMYVHTGGLSYFARSHHILAGCERVNSGPTDQRKLREEEASEAFIRCHQEP